MYEQIEKQYNRIIHSDIFRQDGYRIELCEELDILVDLINTTETDETVWCIGEGWECTLDELIVGAYWSLTEWHDGKGIYATLCNLSTIFSPGMTDGPESYGEETAYELIGDYFKSFEVTT